MGSEELNERRYTRAITGWVTAIVLVALFYGTAYAVLERSLVTWLLLNLFAFGGSMALGGILAGRLETDRLGAGIMLGTLGGLAASAALTLYVLSQIPID